MIFEVVEYDETMRDYSYEWLRDEELRRLTKAEDITKEQQLEWFRLLPERKDYLIRGVTVDGAPAAVFGLKNITGARAEYFALIGPEDLRGKGIGRFMHESMVALAREHGITRIWGAANNPRSYGAHLSFGWRDSGRLDDRGITIIEYDIPEAET